jgi:sn-glycerol 3-phosphate transport system permease protein
MKRSAAWLLLPASAALLWILPFAWMALASVRQSSAGSMDLASLLPAPPFSLVNFRDAWQSGRFPLCCAAASWPRNA